MSVIACFIILVFSMSGILMAQNKNITKGCSIINLIATPEKYHNQKVRVIGFAKIEFEGNAIYLSENDAKVRISSNALWLSIGKDFKKYRPLHNKYVIVEGRFDANAHGHGGLFSGGIKEINRLHEWRIK